MSSKTEAIMSAVLSERLYQLRRWGFRQNDGTFVEREQTIEAFTLFMQDYLNEAIHILSREAYPVAYPKALDTLRKVVTLGVAMFEQHGVSMRDPNTPVINGRDGLPA